MHDTPKKLYTGGSLPLSVEDLARVRTWHGGTQCQCCGAAEPRQIVDGRTAQGPWGTFCRECHLRIGVGLGTGRGQLYERRRVDRLGRTDVPEYVYVLTAGGASGEN